jgi:hypothetical protein
VHSPASGSGLFRQFERLTEIILHGCPVSVPENNSVLRCLQFLSLDRVSAGNYCWNGDCANCRIWFEGSDGRVSTGLACRMPVRSGLVITALSPDLEAALQKPSPMV